MRFTPKPVDHSVNVSRTHPLVELLWLTGGLVVLVGVVFLILGLLTDWAVSKTPPDVEEWLGEQALKHFPGEQNSALLFRLQALLADLPVDSSLKGRQFRVYLADTKEVNAFALPGNIIVVNKGLLKEVESENELSMVLGHELGHIAHRDHLRGLGRGLGLAVAATILFGSNSRAGNLVSDTFLTYQASYSRTQEIAADDFGLDLLVRHYGHAGGAVTFFKRLARKAGSEMTYLRASHPHPAARIENLERLIQTNRYPIYEVEPFTLDVTEAN